VFLIDKLGVALRERSTRRVLSGKSYRHALHEQCAEGERLGRCPVEAFSAFEHLSFGLELARDRAMNMETLGHVRDRTTNLLQRFDRRGSLAATVAFWGHRESCPAAVQPIRAVGAM